MLDMRCVGDTVGAGAFQNRQLVQDIGGLNLVFDRRGLEAGACRRYKTKRSAHAELSG